jgi:hypothetical protein
LPLEADLKEAELNVTNLVKKSADPARKVAARAVYQYERLDVRK